MNIYIAHSRSYDFKNELYIPIRNSFLNEKHNFVLPHENSDKLFDSKRFFELDCDILIAEVSYPALGLGIELGWANLFGVKIICIYKKGYKLSNSLKAVSKDFIEYLDSEELISKLEKNLF